MFDFLYSFLCIPLMVIPILSLVFYNMYYEPKCIFYEFGVECKKVHAAVENVDFKEDKLVQGTENQMHEMCHLLNFVVDFVQKIELNVGACYYCLKIS